MTRGQEDKPPHFSRRLSCLRVKQIEFTAEEGMLSDQPFELRVRFRVHLLHQLSKALVKRRISLHQSARRILLFDVPCGVAANAVKELSALSHS